MPQRASSILRTAVLLALLLALAAPLRAQATGTIRGSVLSDGDRRPVAFALVVLVGSQDGAARRTALSDSTGAYRFAGLEPGSYRLLLERIGFARQVSPALRVAEGATVTHDFVGRARPLVLEGITARAGCFTADALARDTVLAALWEEARKGVETRRALDRRYRYAFDLWQRTETQLLGRGGGGIRRDSVGRTVLNDPDSAAVYDRRRRERRARGYGVESRRGLDLELPEEKELLDPEFLRTHCLESGFEQEDGAYVLYFRPVRPARGRIDLQGQIRVDARDFQVRSLTFEYVRGRGKPFMTATLTYGDVHFPDGTIRMPVSGEFRGRPQGALRRSVGLVRGTVAYRNFRM